MNGQNWVPRVLTTVTFALLLVGLGVQVVAQPSTGAGTEAPAKFDNKTNDFLKDQKDFDADRDTFDEVENVFVNGLGPVYNSTACVGCHQNAGFVDDSSGTPNRDTSSEALSGTSSQISEIRAGHTISGGTLFVEAPGGSVIQQRATDPRVQETVPDDEKIRTLRMATSTLGDGFVEFIPDAAIEALQAHQDSSIRGTIVRVPVPVGTDPNHPKVEDPDHFVFRSRPGRFGWKCQHASLLSFAADAYVTEMGITNPLQQVENSFLGDDAAVKRLDPIPGLEDDLTEKKKSGVIVERPFGKDVQAFTRFMRATKAPPSIRIVPGSPEERGRQRFDSIGCSGCHVADWQTARSFLDIDSELLNEEQRKDVNVEALLNKIIHPYSDFMLHDIGTGDGIVQTQYAERPPHGLNPLEIPLLQPSTSRLLTPTDVSTLRRSAVSANAAKLTNDLKTDPRVSGSLAKLNALLSGVNPPGTEQPAGIRPSLVPRGAAVQQKPAIQADVRIETTRLSAGRVVLTPRMVFTTTTANMIRTAPLWGLRTRPQLLHNGHALTLRDAIDAHRGQASQSRQNFIDLGKDKQDELIAFLRIL